MNYKTGGLSFLSIPRSKQGSPCYKNSNKYLRNENVEKIFRMFNKVINNDPGAVSKKYLKNLLK